MATKDSEIEVIGSQARVAETPTRGVSRTKAFDSPGVLVSQSQIDPNVVSDWHHHAKRTLYGYVVRGRLRFDFGPRGARSVEVSAGDHFRIPPGLVHRDVNLSHEVPAVVVAVLLGEGTPTVNTDGPSSE